MVTSLICAGQRSMSILRRRTSWCASPATSGLRAAFFRLKPQNTLGRNKGCLACLAARHQAYATREVAFPDRKVCGRCSMDLPATAFHQNARSAAGLMHWCACAHASAVIV